MPDIKKLIELCKCSVSLEVNKYRDYYQSVQDAIIEANAGDEAISPAIAAKMIELDTIVELQFYPRTPIGFHLIYHYDVDLAIGEALEFMKSIEQAK